MSQSAAEANAIITTQPLINPPNEAAEVITTQPMMNELPTDEEQEEKKQQRNNQVIETIDEVANDCSWCCFTSADCAPNCDCTGCDNCCDGSGDCCTGCDNCCDGSGDCCTGCCDDVPSGDAINGDDVAGCLECCGACMECCND